jgi:hypothetical protein
MDVARVKKVPNKSEISDFGYLTFFFWGVLSNGWEKRCDHFLGIRLVRVASDP